jgi:hypothetical protein
MDILLGSALVFVMLLLAIERRRPIADPRRHGDDDLFRP